MLMLKVTVPKTELFDETINEFISIKEHKLTLEHSLVSLSKWEAKWKKPFLTKDNKTIPETIDYIRCMTITQNVDDNVYRCLSDDVLSQVKDYISDEMTATTFSDLHKKAGKKEIITSELIYYWMVALNVPFECQKWHLNRLLVLVNICNIKNAPPKKMRKNEMLQRNASINAARKKALNSRG